MDKNEIQAKKGIRAIRFKGGEALTMKEVDLSKREVHMVLNAFGNRDDDGDVVHKGAFAKSLAERGVDADTPRKIAYLKYHDMQQPLGVFKELFETDRGLEAVGVIDRTQFGDDTLVQIQSGTLNQHSIGFEYVWDKMEYDEEEDTFHIKELNLWEGSLVKLGVNENTPIVEVRGKFTDAAAEIFDDLEKHLKSIEYKSQFDIRKIFSRLLALAEYGAKPSKDTLRTEKQAAVDVIDFGKIAEVIKFNHKIEQK